MNQIIYRKEIIRNGISFGSVLAIVMSWSVNKSVLWAIFHGIIGWIYVLYYILFK